MATSDQRSPRIFRFADLELDEGRQRVLRDGKEVPLPKLSFDLLLVLLDAAPNFVPNRQLMARVWPGLVIGDKTVSQRVKLLRDALGDDHEEPRYIAGLRGRGYCIQPPVTQLMAPASTAPTPTQVQNEAPSGTRRMRADSSLAWIVVVAAIAATVAGTWWLRGASPTSDSAIEVAESDAAAPRITVAVLPFRDLSGNAGEIARGVPEAVLDSLSTLPDLSVIARDSSFRAAERERGVQEIGRRLGARYLVDGNVQRADDTLRVSAQLIDAEAGTQVWAERYDHGIADIFAIQDRIAASVAEALSARAAGAVALRSTKPTGNIEAYLAYLRGRTLLARWTVVDADAAIQALESAIELDPSFAAAYASLYDARLMAAERRCGSANPAVSLTADSGCPLGTAKADYQSLIDKALSLDSLSGTAYFARAIWADDASRTREADFRRGLELDPSNGRGITAYAEFLDRAGRNEEATRMLERAIRVDPLSPRAYFWRVMRGAPADAATLEAGMLSVLEVDPDYVPALQRYAKYRWILHAELAQAIRLIEHALSLDPRNPWLLYTAIAMYLDIGNIDDARALQAGAERAEATGRILLLLYEGDARGASDAALAGLGFAQGVFENWGVYGALREHAVESGEYARPLDYLEQHTGLGESNAIITVRNFRAVPAVAQLHMMAGRQDLAGDLLRKCIRWIDEVHLPDMGGAFALRIKAEAQLLLGDPESALETLEASFTALDYVQWWYTLDRDALWTPLRKDPRFVAIAAQVRRHVGEQRQALMALQEQGAVPRRAGSRVAVTNGSP